MISGVVGTQFLKSNPILHKSPFLCLCGLSEGVFPGVPLLSRCRRSGFPVDFAVLFGPGLIQMISVF